MHTYADCVPVLNEFRSDRIDRCMDKITLIWRFACQKSGCCWSHKLQWLFFFFFFLLSSSFSPCLLRRPFFLLSPSSSWGACAGLPRPYLGWCPSVGVRVLLATSLPLLLLLSSFFFFFALSSSSSFLPSVSLLFLGCMCWFTTSLPGVVSQCRGACVAGHVPFPFCLFFFFFVLSPSVSLLFLGCACWFTTSWPGVVSQCRGACVAGHVPSSSFSSSSSSFFFFALSSSSSFLPSVSLLFLGCVCWFTMSLPGVVSQCRGACVAGHVPSSSASSASSSSCSSLSCLFLSPSSSWGACAGLPRPDLGWCPSFGVRVLLATSLPLLLLFLLLLFRPVFFVVPSRPSVSFLFLGACAGLPRPDLGWCHSVGVHVLLATSLLLLLFLLPFFFFFALSSSLSFLPSVSLLFLGCVCWFTTSLPGVVSQCRGACVAGHVPSSSASSASSSSSCSSLSCLFLSPSSSWGACAGLPRS